MGQKEFVALMACLMAISVLALDAIVPALPDIGTALGVVDENSRQSLITVFWLGLGLGQLLYGPLTDRYGRRPVLIGSLLVYALFGILAGLAGSMSFLLAMRFLQGVAAAGEGVLVVAIIRDRFKGDEQARVQSLIAFIFLFVPVVAPPLAQLLLEVADWRELLVILASAGLVLAGWSYIRLPETLAREHHRPLTGVAIGAALAEIGRNRAVAGNILVATLMMTAFAAFIHSIGQIVADVYGRPGEVGFVFVYFAGPVAFAYLLNMWLVPRFGARRLLLAALAATAVLGLIHLAVAVTVGETFWTFVVLQSLTMVWIGLTNANCASLTYETVGHIAGTASACRGFFTTLVGASLGFLVGQMFDGSPVPLIAAFAACGTLALLAALWANPARVPAPA